MNKLHLLSHPSYGEMQKQLRANYVGSQDPRRFGDYYGMLPDVRIEEIEDPSQLIQLVRIAPVIIELVGDLGGIIVAGVTDENTEVRVTIEPLSRTDSVGNILRG